MKQVDIVTEMGKLGIRIAEGCGRTSDIDLGLILGLENDWAALDSPLWYSLILEGRRGKGVA